MAKTIKINATFEVLEPSTKSQEGKQVIVDQDDFNCVTTLHPIKVAGSLVKTPVGLGGVGLAKRIYIKTDEEVLVHFNSTGENGFNLKGELIVMNESGITALFITTGPSATTLTVVAAGDA